MRRDPKGWLDELAVYLDVASFAVAILALVFELAEVMIGKPDTSTYLLGTLAVLLLCGLAIRVSRFVEKNR